MKDEVFDRLILQLEIGCGSYPALTGHHLTQEQYNKIYSILLKRKDNIDRYINMSLKCRLRKETK